MIDKYMMINANGNSNVPVEFLICDDRKLCKTCKLPQCIAKARKARLMVDVTYYLPGLGILTIRAGFEFDGASIPAVFWLTKGHPFDHLHLRSTLLHDGLCAAQITTRAVADKVFLDFMHYADRVCWYTRNTIYQAVNWFGGSSWNGKTPESIAAARQLITLIPENAV